MKMSLTLGSLPESFPSLYLAGQIRFVYSICVFVIGEAVGGMVIFVFSYSIIYIAHTHTHESI